jgi:DNA-binding MarR family transcriptional regulator
MYHLTMGEGKSSGKSRGNAAEPRGASSPAFLLAQIGAHAASRFGERLAALALTPAHAGLLRVISSSDGASQQQVALTLGMFASRMVALVDELEEKKLVERLPNPEDRRTYSLALTAEGRRVLDAIGRVAREHQDDLLAALNKAERDALAALLLRVADQQGLIRGVHPGFARMATRRSGALKNPRRMADPHRS